MQPPAARRSLDPVRGLILLALANVLFFLALSWLTAHFYSTFLSLPWALVSLKNAIVQSQRAGYGIAAALIPQRRFVGLTWATGLGMLCGLVHVDFLNVVSLARAHFGLRLDEMLAYIAIFADQTVATFVITQAMRFALGWRLTTTTSELMGVPGGQFRVGDLLEWTASVAVWLGIHRFTQTDLFDYWETTLCTAAILIPIALAATSQPGLRWNVVIALVAWNIALEALVWAEVYIRDSGRFTFPWWFYLSMSAAGTAGYFLATGINFAIIRALGYRWTAAPRAARA